MPFFSLSSPTSGNATQLQARPVSATAPATGAVLVWSGSAWLPGPGVTGPTGTAGVDGAKIFSGTGAPSAGLGRSGDFYIDTTADSGRLYGPKANNAWGVGIVLQSGPVGPTGPQSTVTGPTGPASTVTGPTGPGVTGPTGPASTVTGPTGPQMTGPTGPSSTVTGPTGAIGSFNAAQDLNARVTDYALALTDAGKLVTCNAASGSIRVTIPQNSNVAFPTGTHVDIARLGDATVLVTGATGVTVNATPGQNLRAKFSAGSAIMYSTNTWLLIGDLS